MSLALDAPAPVGFAEKIWRINWGLVLVLTAIAGLGVLALYSAAGGRFEPWAARHAVRYGAAFGLMLVVALIHPKVWLALAWPIYVVSMLLLVAVDVVGKIGMGAQRWLMIGPMQIQPSEIAKLALALWIAQAVVRRPTNLRTPKGLAPVLLVTAALGLLILIEPDMGTAVTLCAVAFSMLVVAGARMRHLGALIGAGVFLAAMAILIEPYRRERLMIFLDPWSDPNGSGFQSVQAQVALGSGGLHGVGLGDGVQKAFYLPEAHTDMILATVGEELGLIGVLAVLVAFGLFAVAGYRIALSARDLHQQVLAAGLTTLVVVQAAINIGAVVGVLPVTGVPLPFVSFGGSSLIILLACSGLLVNIGRRSQRQARRLAVVPPGEGRDRGRGDGRPRDAGAGRGRRAARAGG